MVNYRLAGLLNAESTTTAATKTIDLDMTNPISQILIEFKGTNNGSTPTAHPAKAVTKIEIVDGSDVLYSLSGIECQALNFYEEGKFPTVINEAEDNIQSVSTFHLNFGRYLWDTELALDTNRFKNLQLKITHNKALGGSAPDAATMSVFANVFEDKKVSPRGFLMAKEVYSYSLSSSAHEYIDLPTDYDIRYMIVQSLAAGKMPHEQYNKIKLAVDNDSRIIINNESTSSLAKLITPVGRIRESFAGLGSGSAITYYIASTYDVYAAASGRSASQTTLIVAQPYGGTCAVTNDSSESFHAVVDGLCPHGAFCYPFGDDYDPADWLKVAGMKVLKLDLTAGSSVGSSSTAEIVLQQYRPYR